MHNPLFTIVVIAVIHPSRITTRHDRMRHTLIPVCNLVPIPTSHLNFCFFPLAELGVWIAALVRVATLRSWCNARRVSRVVRVMGGAHELGEHVSEELLEGRDGPAYDEEVAFQLTMAGVQISFCWTGSSGIVW